MVRDSVFDLKLVVAFGNFDPFHFFIQKELGNDDIEVLKYCTDLQALDLGHQAVTDISEMAIKAFVENDNFVAFQIDPLEEVIDDLCDRIKNHHIERVSRKECSLETGFVFNDLLTDYERISDHCSNIAVDVIESEQGLFGQHQYHQILNEAQDEAFHTYFDDFKKEYSLD